MDNLVVDGQLTALIRDNKDTDTATAIVEAVIETAEEVALVKDRKTLLDVAGLGHGNDAAIVTDVEDAVLLEDRAEHVLDNNRRARVADEAGLLVELLGEEVHTQVAVLAGLCRGGDADDLARTALQDEQVADPDVVAGDGDGVGNHVGAGRGVAGRDALLGFVAGSGGHFALLDDDVFLNTLRTRLVVMVVVSAVDRMEDTVGGTVKSVTEGVVVAVFVVISHVTLVLGSSWAVDGGLAYTDLLVESDWVTLWVALSRVVTRVRALVLPAAGLAVVLLGARSGAGAVVLLGYVNTTVEVVLGSRSVAGRILSLVAAVLNVDLVVDVAVVRLTVAVKWILVRHHVRWYSVRNAER